MFDVGRNSSLYRLELEIKIYVLSGGTFSSIYLALSGGPALKNKKPNIHFFVKHKIHNEPGSIPEYSELDVVVWTPFEFVSLPPSTPRACSLTSSGFTWRGSNRSHWPISFIIWSRVIRSGLLILVRFFNISLPSSSLLENTFNRLPYNIDKRLSLCVTIIIGTIIL